MDPSIVAGPTARSIAARTFHGPNPFAADPVVLVTLRAGDWSGIHTELALQRLQGHFATWMRGWVPPTPSLSTLAPAQGVGLLAAHWARGLLNAVRGLIDCAGAMACPPDAVQVWVGWHEPDLSLSALELALDLVGRLGRPGTPAPSPQQVERIRVLLEACRNRHPDYQSRVLMLGARSIGCPVQASPGDRHWQFGWGRHGRVFFESSPGEESARGRRMSTDKLQTNAFLRHLGLPATVQRAAQTLAEARVHAQELGWPVVVKPSDQGKGRGVSVGVDSSDRLDTAFERARAVSARPVVVERQLAGLDHRLLVLRGELVDVLTREPASVAGDGRCSVRALVAGLNARRMADPLQARYLRQVAVDDVVLTHLARQGLDLDSVPEAGRRVVLRGNANLSTGGEPVSVAARVHPQVRAMACAIAQALDLRCVGVDYMTSDISRPPAEVGGAVIEVNAMPGLDPHLVVGAFDEPTLGRLVLGPEPGRIPVAVVLAEPSVQQALMADLDASGWACDDHLGVIGAGRMRLGGLDLVAEGPWVLQRTRQLLAHRRCHAAVVMVAPDEVANLGLPVDRCTLAIASAPADAAAGDDTLEVARRHTDQWLQVDAQDGAARARVLDRLSTWAAAAGTTGGAR